jgi:hypothetical protein
MQTGHTHTHLICREHIGLLTVNPFFTFFKILLFCKYSCNSNYSSAIKHKIIQKIKNKKNEKARSAAAYDRTDVQEATTSLAQHIAT